MQYYNKYDEKLDTKCLDIKKPLESLYLINTLFDNGGFREVEEYKNKLENEIKNLIVNYSIPPIERIIKVISLIQMYQIFYDGNKRTSVIFFTFLMETFYPNINLNIFDNEKKFVNVFPILYCEDEEIDSNKSQKILKKIIV